jgi:hypothetical protein
MLAFLTDWNRTSQMLFLIPTVIFSGILILLLIASRRNKKIRSIKFAGITMVLALILGLAAASTAEEGRYRDKTEALMLIKKYFGDVRVVADSAMSDAHLTIGGCTPTLNYSKFGGEMLFKITGFSIKYATAKDTAAKVALICKQVI